MFHSLDSVNSSPIVLSDFSRSSIEEDVGYNTIYSGTGLLSFDIDFPHFDPDSDISSIFSSATKEEFSPSISGIASSTSNPFNFGNEQYGYYGLSIQTDNAKIEDTIKGKKKCLKKKSAEIRRKSKPVGKKPIVLQPFASVWSVETSVKKLREYQFGIGSDDQEE